MAGGQQITVGQGSVSIADGVTLALVGTAITVSAGLLIGGSNGQVATFGQGSVTQSAEVALTGIESTTGQGTIVYGGLGQITLVGSEIVSSGGSIAASGDGVEVVLSGVEATFFDGIVERGPSPVTGEAVTATAGSGVPSVDVALVGSESACSAGTITPGIEASEDTFITSGSGAVIGGLDVALTGSEFTSAAGTLSTDDGEATAVGEEVAVDDGTIAPVQEVAIAGQSITTAQGVFGAPGGAELTGSTVTVTAGEIFIDADRSYALTGIEIQSQTGTTFASPVCFYSGQTITVSQEGIGPRTLALIGIAIVSGITSMSASAPQQRRGGGSIIPVPRKGKKFLVKEEETEPTIAQIVDAALAKAKPPLKGRKLEDLLKGQLDATDDDDTIGGEDSEDDDLLIS